ncbi:bubble precursor [Fusarium mundagurra]|uniref:Bubble n=1 Tax=Fusarium mundagurra TaxID=1567541 RepID=A0A8H5Y882_9HYPO|nr:bubble precursor [Fusarium mundagurra]
MKFAIILTTFWVAAVTAAPADNELFSRDDCGKGGAPYTRRTNSKCGTGNGQHTYCGCDRTGIVQCIGGHWREIYGCPVTVVMCYGTGAGASCRPLFSPP